MAGNNGKKRWYSWLVIGLFSAVAVQSTADDTSTLPVRLDNDGFREVLADTGKVYIAGQPTIEGLARMKREGVRTVISLRTAREMDDREIVPFDEQAEVRRLGMQYIHVPLGGDDTPYTPEAVSQVAAAIAGTDGKVLLHCTVAWRASHMWAAYLVRNHNLSIADAVTHARVINFGTLPLSGLLGEELVFSTD